MRVGRRALTADSTAEPLSLQDAKDHLRVSSTAEDFLITSYVKAARQVAERFTRRSFVNQDYDVWLDDFPVGDVIDLWSPLNTSTGKGGKAPTVTYYPSSGGSKTFASSNYIVDDISEPGRIVLKDNETWPTEDIRQANAVQISFTAGYGASSDVPEGIKHGLRLMLGTNFEHREDVIVGSVAAKIPRAAESLLWSYRVPHVP